MEGCPSREQLQRALRNQLDGPEQTAIETHVEECPSCRETLASLSEDAEVEEWRNLLRPDPSPDRDDSAPDFLLPHAVERLSPADDSSPDGGEMTAPTIRFSGPPTASGPLGRLGPYHVREELGSGASGFVYLAYDDQLRRTVAIKVLRPELAASPHGRARFEREARVAVSVRHDHVVTIHHVGGPPEFPLPFLVMEFIEGETLADRLRRDGLIPPRDAAEIARQVVLGLAYAHERGLVHRDIKPSNIMLEAGTGRAKLTDFGIARAAAESDVATNARVTQSGQVVGTPAYMSPEQIASPERIDGRSDLYSLGVVLYELLTGERPFRGTQHTVMHQITLEEPPSPHSLNGSIPRDLETITLKCLEKDPARRYRSAADLAVDLERWQTGRPIEARPASFRERVWKWARRRPALASTLGAAGIAAVIFVSVILGFNARLWRSKRDLERSLASTREARDTIARERDRNFIRLQQDGLAEAERSLRQNLVNGKMALDVVPPSRRGWEWDRMNLEFALVPTPRRVIGTHGHGVVAGLVAGAGRTIVTSGQDGRVIAWDSESGEGKELEGGSWSNTIAAWRRVRTPYKNDDPPDALAPDCFVSLCHVGEGDRLAGASLHGKGVVWDLDSGRRRIAFEHSEPLGAVAAAPDGESLLWGDTQGRLLFQNIRKEGVHLLALESRAAVMKIVPLPSSGWIVGQWDGSLSLVDAGVTAVRTRETVAEPLWDVDLSPEGTVLGVACAEFGLVTFEIDADKPGLRRGTVYPTPEDERGEPLPLRSVRFSPDKSRICAGDDTGRLHIWGRGTRSMPSTARPPGAFQDDPDSTPLLRRPMPAILFSPDGDTLYTAGHDSALKQWDWPTRRGVLTLRVGSHPHTRFDRTNPTWLWVGAADGSLTLFDTHPERAGRNQRPPVSAHVGPVTGLDIAPETGMIATCGDDRTIGFWTLQADAIREARPKITHTHRLRGVALSPDGARVAAYDADDHVNLWDGRTGRLIRRLAMREAGADAAVAGVVAFNRDGQTLAAAGPGQSLWILDGGTLDLRHRLDGITVAGKGGTAIAWDPADSERVLVGDTSGRLASFSSRVEPYRTASESDEAIAGVAFSPDGKRIAAVSREGTLRIFDPRGVGLVLTRQSRRDHPSGLLFDASGLRLVLLHEGGWIDLWESRPVTHPPAEKARPWTETVLSEGAAADGVSLSPSAVAASEDGPILYLRVRPVGGAAGPRTWQVVLGLLRGPLQREVALLDVGPLDSQTLYRLNNSMALAVWQGKALVFLRRPVGRTVGQPLLLRLSFDPRVPSVDINHVLQAPLEEPGHAGFHPHVGIGQTGEAEVLHFSHSGYYLFRCRQTDGNWVSERIGRQGDGLWCSAALANDGSWHTLFVPHRFSGDGSSLTYCRAGSNPVRQVVDPAVGVNNKGLTLAADGTPIVLYNRPASDGREEVMVARRAGDGWRRDTAFDWCGGTLSNPDCARDGGLRFAYIGQDDRRIMLATGRQGNWTTEPLGLLPEPTWNDEEVTLPMLVVRHDATDAPVVFAAHSATGGGWLRVYQPAR